jgi:hypothetical protein
MNGAETPERSWQRERLSLLWEKAPYPRASIRLGADLWLGQHLDRFSAPSPARFGNLRLKGIATGAVYPERLAMITTSFATPLSARVRGEIGVDAAWAKEARSGYENQPFAGFSAGVTAPGPWGTLLQGSVGYPLVTPGARRPTLELFVLYALGGPAGK